MFNRDYATARAGAFEKDLGDLCRSVVADQGDFYERDLYCLSNFSSFRLSWKGINFDTSEHAYHWEKYNTDQPKAMHIQWAIKRARSAHEAFFISNHPDSKPERRKDWDKVKVYIMKQILNAKFDQHEYVRKKLRQAYDKRIRPSERSWRDSFWGTGEDGRGEDTMGGLWTEIMHERFS